MHDSRKAQLPTGGGEFGCGGYGEDVNPTGGTPPRTREGLSRVGGSGVPGGDADSLYDPAGGYDQPAVIERSRIVDNSYSIALALSVAETDEEYSGYDRRFAYDDVVAEEASAIAYEDLQTAMDKAARAMAEFTSLHARTPSDQRYRDGSRHLESCKALEAANDARSAALLAAYWTAHVAGATYERLRLSRHDIEAALKLRDSTSRRRAEAELFVEHFWDKEAAAKQSTGPAPA